MTKISVRDAVLAVLTGIVGVAGSYMATGSTSAFVGAPVASVVFNSMPAAIVTFSILVFGKFGELLGFALALALTVGLFAGLVLVSFAVERRVKWRFGGSVLTTGLTWGAASLLTRAPVMAIGAAAPMGAVLTLFAWRSVSPDQSSEDAISRRDVIGGFGTLLGFLGLAVMIGNRQTPEVVYGQTSQTHNWRVEAALHEAETNSLDINGMPGLVSEENSFYEVDVNIVNPTVRREDWRLTITGDVTEVLTIDYDEVTSQSPTYEFVTLRCVGDSLNGTLMDTGLWTVVPLMEYVDRAGPIGERVVLHGDDGYYEEFPLAALEEGYLAYELNGKPLPRKHGHPVRALVLGHWGEINVKWITKIEVLKESVDGYWEKRGWHGTGPVIPVAKLWAVNQFEGGRIQIGGHAYAGLRGIRRVEVSIDGGSTWEQTELSEPLPSRDAWRQWTYKWDATKETYDVVVRAIDGKGDVQPQGDANPYPSGARGWVTKTVEAEPGY